MMIIRYSIRGVGSNFGLVRQLRIGQANEPGWAGCSMAIMLKMTNCWLLVIFSEILVRQFPDLPDLLLHPCPRCKCSFHFIISIGSYSYHNQTFDYFEATGSPNHSFTNTGYQSNVSYPDGAAGFNNSQGYSPAPPRSTSTPLVPKVSFSSGTIIHLLSQ